MDRFFIENRLALGEETVITGGDAFHIIRTLRLRVGEKLEIATPLGVFLSELTEISKGQKEAKVKAVNLQTVSHEPEIYIRLFQGLPKGQKLDLVVQKAVEIGISEMIPVELSRSVAKLPKNDKLSRYQKIAKETAQQAKRDIVPIVREAITFFEAEKFFGKDDIILVPYEEERVVSVKVLREIEKPKVVNLFIGPEGGFSPDEISTLKALGAKIFSLGNRILRTETAGVIAAALIFYEYGEMNHR